MKTFNEQEFMEYRLFEKGKHQRFFQALRNYMDVGYIFLAESDNEIPDRQNLKDTFYL